MVLAAIDERAVTAIAVAAGLVIFGGLLIATAWGELKGRRIAKVAPGMRPAPSDEELERRVIERYLLWGGVTTLFIALWLPALWFYMPTFLEHRRTQIGNFDTFGLEHAQERDGGGQLFEDFCLRCHGAQGEGGFQPFVREGEQAQYAEPPLALIFARYKAAGRSDDEVTRIVRDAIERGRPGTPMPTWSLAFGGPFNSYQIDNLVAFIKHFQISPEEYHERALSGDEEFEGYADMVPAPGAGQTAGEAIFNANCAICHGVGGSGRDAEGNLTVGPNLRVALQRYTVDEIRTTIEEGRLNLNRPSMPSWAFLEELRSGAIDALIEFIRSIQRS